jgi:hypothetical protein
MVVNNVANVCGSFWRVDKIQNGRYCYGNQGAKIVKFIPSFKKLHGNVSRHMQICIRIVFTIPMFLAYLVPLDVGVVPIKFHQFLFGE